MMSTTVAATRGINGRTAACLRRVSLAVLMSTASHACFAQSATPGSTITLDPIVVQAPGDGA
jgi:iron complex outermembrane receptor protein